MQITNNQKINLRTLILPLLCGLFSPLLGQEQHRDSLLATARAEVATLTSREFAGRGYQEDGHTKAATYIAKRFKDFGLEPIPGGQDESNLYFQKFRFSVNLIDSLFLEVNGEKMEEGVDFIAGSATGRGSRVNSSFVDAGYFLPDDQKKYGKKIKGKIVVIHSGLPSKIAKDKEAKKRFKDWANDLNKVQVAVQAGAKGIIILKEKLTAGLSVMPLDIPILEVRSKVWPKKVKSIKMKVKASLQGVNSQNVAGMVTGTMHPDSFVIVCGHYDHLGMQGKAVFWGANDNASGIATVLSMANHFALPENQPDYSMVFIAFGGEEAGLIGSRHYVNSRPLVPLSQTSFVLNLDLMGNGDEGITVVGGKEFDTAFSLLEAVNTGLEATPKVKKRGNAPNSDHYFFIKQGVPAFFIYTLGGPPHYHDVNDTPDHLVFSRYVEVRSLLIKFMEDLMRLTRTKNPREGEKLGQD